ncbi:MAG: pyridoxal 5'-phosphate synthase glutaminase subunit PdxT [Actinobacteria bacterium]|nr:pyridoxal 5'-phosphate synthase glutaminase subunit PdxT [Actinomycetota bacterium]MBU1494485.1 pyridoxal 5'-phosphate synthase glutaminase subunit PdxT [Actinomycetota bacterium]
MVTVRVGVLALQGDFREHAASFERAGAETVLVRTAGQLEGIDVLVIPGGESTTIGKLADRFGLLEPIRTVVAGGLPTLGTCAGMIFLATGTTGPEQVQAGVLDVVVERNAFGRQVDSFEADLDVDGFDAPVHAVFIRAPWIAGVGPGVEVLAEVEGHPVVVRQGNVVATSFHPELTGDDRFSRLLLAMAGER